MPDSTLLADARTLLADQLPQYTEADRERLAVDVVLVYEEKPAGDDDDWYLEDAYDEWMWRLGGPQNVPSYLACLRAGDRWRTAV